MEDNKVQVAASILAGDFGALADEAKRIQDSGADSIHIDVMDGHFVKNLTFGPKACSAINRACDLFLDVHLMIYNPFDYVERFVESGADRITFHFEATEDVSDILNYIRRCNVAAGLAFSPETSGNFIPKYVSECDLVLVMTVHPGFGGQKFIPETLNKVRLIRDYCNKNGIRKSGKKDSSLPPFDIQVDGGITSDNSKQCVEAGANVLVSGTYLFESPNMSESIESLRKC